MNSKTHCQELDLKYRAEIDGLRAIAVISVIFFHAGFDLFGGGFIGVDIFFVISGYLITTIIVADINNDQFTLSNFYEKRARRILPALFVVLIASYFVAWQFLPPADLKELAQSMFASSIFTSNIYFYLKTGYFDTVAELKPLLHTWSLSIEEQFYVIFPIFLLVSWRFGKKKIFWLILGFTLTSLLASEWSWRHDPAANFYLIHTRAWELFAGSLAAFFVLDKGVQKQDSLAILGLAMIVFSIFILDENTPIPSAYGLIPVLGTVLLIIYGDNRTFAGKLLGHKTLVGLGLVSYSAYLWHQPIFALTKQYFIVKLSVGISIGLIFLTFFVSIITWRFIEQPIRQLPKSDVNRKLIFCVSLLALCLIGSIGVLGHVERGYPNRNPDLMRLAQNYGLSVECNGAAFNNQTCKTQKNPTIAVWGDSHAMHFSKALDQAFPRQGIQQLTLSACPPVPNFYGAPRKRTISCHEYNDIVIRYLTSSNEHHLTTVVIAAKRSLVDPDLQSLFAQAVNRLQKSGLSVVLVTSTPRHTDSKRCLTLAIRNNISLDECRFRFSEATNFGDFEELKNLGLSLGISVVDLSEFICPENLCRLGLNGDLVLRDAGHLSNEIQKQLSLFFEVADAFRDIN